MTKNSSRGVVRTRVLSVSLVASILAASVMACSNDDAATPVSTGSSGPTDQSANQFVDKPGDATAGRDVFRSETFGNEGFWTRVAQLPQGIKEAGVTPLQVLALGLSVDIDSVPAALATAIGGELKTDLSPANAPMLNSPATTEALLEASAVIGLPARNIKLPLNGTLEIDDADVYAGESIGVSCAVCHSRTDGSVYAPKAGTRGGTIGKRLDGQTNHDFQFGKAIALAKGSRALYPTLALNLTANKGGSVSRKGPGVGLISAAGTEAEVDAYLNDSDLYPIGMFDDAPDGNGAPMHTTPLFRADLAAPYGTPGDIHTLHNFGNLVYTALLDPTDLTTDGGKKFLMERGGDAGLEIVTHYEAILADMGIAKGGQNGYPFVGRTMTDVNGQPRATGVAIGLSAGAKVEDSPIGMQVDVTKNLAMSAYLATLKPPAGDKTDATAIGEGRAIFRQQCTSCHRDDQSIFVPQNIAAYNATVDLFASTPTRPDLYPGWAAAEVIADRSAAGLAPVRNSSGIFDDKLVVVDGSNQGSPRGSAFPLLMDLARKPTFLHDDSVPSLDNLLDPARTASAPHPFYVTDAGQRAEVVKFLESLDDTPLP